MRHRRLRRSPIDHRDAAEAVLRVVTDPALWSADHELTGPVTMSWPEALELLSAEIGEPVTFRVGGRAACPRPPHRRRGTRRGG
jgi:uncharacterized protein YbjT (DUF2867 family)